MKKQIVKFIWETIEYAEKDGIVLGLSGGVDSAVCLALAVEALGSDKVHCLWMPYYMKTHSEEFQFYVNILLKLFEIPSKNFYSPWVSDVVEAIIDEFKFCDVSIEDKIDLGNLMARTRMMYLYLFARQNNLLVMGTSNKSEYMTGYFTKWGDGSADFYPIRHLLKTDVFRLAGDLEIPEAIILKAPSAGLYEGQTDEDELGITYVELDQILEKLTKIYYTGYYRNGLIRKFGKTKVEHVEKLVKNSKHKRIIAEMKRK